MKAAEHDFRQIVVTHQARVYSIAFRMLGDTGAAEEVAQDVFVELHRNLDRLESGEHILAWLRRVAVHRATDALRRRACRPEFGAQDFEDGETYVSATDNSSPLATRIEQLVSTLPAAQRSIVLLRYQEGMLPQEIADALSMPLATVKSHLQRALQMLRSKAERTLRKEYTRG